MKQGSSRSKKKTPLWSIDVAANAVVDAARAVVETGVDPALAEARLADAYRDAGVAPLAPEAFATQTAGLNEGDWLRLQIIVGLFDVEELRKTLAGVSASMSVDQQIAGGMVAPAKTLKAVSGKILATSMVRAEELARRAAKGLDVGFTGETAAASAERLTKIDYVRLLAKVDAAKESAEEQMADLFKYQEEEDNRIRRRGKW
jgi:hypothetical protein